MAQVDSESSIAMPASHGLIRQQRERRKALRRVSKLRQKASDEIERLLAFLDASDPYVQTEAEPNGDELDVSYPHGGPRLMTGNLEDDEPSLGSFDRMTDQSRAWSTRDTSEAVDAEHDTADDEPSLGSLDWIDQARWGQGDRRDLEEQCEDEGVAV